MLEFASGLIDVTALVALTVAVAALAHEVGRTASGSSAGARAWWAGTMHTLLRWHSPQRQISHHTERYTSCDCGWVSKRGRTVRPTNRMETE